MKLFMIGLTKIYITLYSDYRGDITVYRVLLNCIKV